MVHQTNYVAGFCSQFKEKRGVIPGVETFIPTMKDDEIGTEDFLGRTQSRTRRGLKQIGFQVVSGAGIRTICDVGQTPSTTQS